MTDLADAQARLHTLRCRMLDRGLDAEPVGVCGNQRCDDTPPKRVPGVAGYCPREWVPAYGAA